MRLWQLTTLVATWTVRSSYASDVVASYKPELQVENVAEPRMFSPQWANEYFGGEKGCSIGRGVYYWRSAGFGSNMNNFLYTWVHALAVKGWQDIAIVVQKDGLRNLACSERSGGDDLRGWDCLFSEIPHVCTFKSTTEWELHLQTVGIPDSHREEAKNVSLDEVRTSRTKIENALTSHGIDYLGALAVLQKNLWDHLTPWVWKRMKTVMQLNGVGSEVNSPYLALHIRRGDKISIQHVLPVPVKDYLSKAREFLDYDNSTASPSAIRGIWVASDDGKVLPEVRHHAVKHFPNLREESIVWISGDTTGKLQAHDVRTKTVKQTFEEFIAIFLDLQHLAGAELFVGTYSSNWGRLVRVMREANDRPRNTTISVNGDKWRPVRRQLVPEEMENI